MTDKKLSALDAATSVDYVYGEASGVSKKITPANVAGFLTAEVDVSSAELKALLSSPKEIIPAPGMGKWIQVLWWSLNYEFGTQPYGNLNDGGTLVYGGAIDDTYQITTIWDLIFGGSEDMVAFGPGFSNSVAGGNLKTQERPFPRSKVEDKSIVMWDYNDWTTGDGTAEIYVAYKIIDF